jgi:hypothetical protein
MYGILKENINTGFDDSELAAGFATPIVISSNRVHFSSDTLSLKRVSSKGPGQRWEIEASIAQTNNSTAFFVNFINDDADGTVYVRMPQPMQKVGGAVGAARASGTAEEYPTGSPGVLSNNDSAIGGGTATAASASKGASSVLLTLDTNSRIFLGNFIRFTNHDKVYMIQKWNDLTTNTADVDIYPPLIEDVSNSEALDLGANVTIPMEYELDNTFGMTFTNGILSDPGTVRMVEAL